MGIKLISTSLTGSAPLKGNPNPKNFKITYSGQYGKYVLLEVVYPECTNYEGRKILLYKGYTLQELKEQTYLDPHFSTTGIAPIARFEPTDDGLNIARKYVYFLRSGTI